MIVERDPPTGEKTFTRIRIQGRPERLQGNRPLTGAVRRDQ
jgi:hypothetical protein